MWNDLQTASMTSVARATPQKHRGPGFESRRFLQKSGRIQSEMTDTETKARIIVVDAETVHRHATSTYSTRFPSVVGR